MARQVPRGSGSSGVGDFRRSLVDTSNSFLALSVVLFAVFLVNTYGMEEASSYLLPRLVCMFGLAVGSLKLIVAFVRPVSPDTATERERGTRGLQVAYSIFFVTVYFLATRWLGFVLATAVAILGFTYLMSFPHKRIAVLLSIAIPLILHIAFVTLLRASLPAGLVETLLF